MKQDKGEVLALIALALILVGLPLGLLGYQFVLRPALAGVPTFDIVAAAPEAGGFRPDAIRVAAGQKVRLRFSAPDVTHGIAFGPGLNLDIGHVDPGEVKEVELTFDRPGRYTYYCNTWCSPSHWRMRGAIEVYDPRNPEALVGGGAPDPVVESLAARGVNIDAPHEAAAVFTRPPSVARGAGVVQILGDRLPEELADPLWRRSHSPVQAWMALLAAGLEAEPAWDAVAYLWVGQTDPAVLESAARLYAKNCAACHGESGDGTGPGADALAAQGLSGQGVEGHAGMAMPEAPPAFAEPRTMLGGASEVYYAKLRRGGMGTGMPSFGPLLTVEETWGLVDYLWTFVFETEQAGR